MPPTSPALNDEPTASPLRIHCIGDSITQGVREDRDEFTYRLPLQEMLLERGIQFEFIGSRIVGVDRMATWPEVHGRPFDPAHEGYYGATTTYVRDELRAVLPVLPVPDIALIHLGTNDQNAGNFETALVTPLADIVTMLRGKNPKVTIFLGHLNFHGGPALVIRPLVEDLATRLHEPGSPVVTVPHYEGWKAHPDDPATDTFDWVHPNPRGQRKMATAWLAAMTRVMPGVLGSVENR